MKIQCRLIFAGFLSCFALTGVDAQLVYSVTDLGTLGGSASTAFSVGGQGPNAAGMIVGSSTTSDNSEHAFLFVDGQMFDLNALCDLSHSDFKALTVAKAINDSCIIIGEGITNNGDKHAFMLSPLSVQGGQWSYRCCQWVWIEDGECYGSKEEALKHCAELCWCCIDGKLVRVPATVCRERNGQCYGSREEALRHCAPPPPPSCWCCINGQVIETTPQMCEQRGGQCYGSREEAFQRCAPPPGRPTPTPGITTWIPGVQPTPTPPPPARVTPTPNPNNPNIRGLSTPTPTPRIRVSRRPRRESLRENSGK